MKTALTEAIVFAVAVSTSPCLAQDGVAHSNVISEEEARMVSERLYTNILVTACRNGWRYPRKQVELGFKRHLTELKLQLSHHGYTFVSGAGSSNYDKSRPARLIAAGNRKPRFGCARPYWFKISG